MSGDDVLAVIDREIAELEAQIRPLQEKRDWLRALKRKAGTSSNGSKPTYFHPKPRPESVSGAASHAKAEADMNVNDLIIGFVKGQGGGPIPRRDIVEFLLSRKKSTSKNPRQMMFGYITGLVSKEHLTNSGTGLVSLGPVPWNPKGREG